MPNESTDDRFAWLTAGMDLPLPATARWRRRRDGLPDQADVLRSVLSGMADAVVFADAAGRVFLYNPAAERLLGDGLADLRLDDWAEQCGFYLPDQATGYPPDRLPLAQAVRGHGVDDAEIFLRNPLHPEGVWLSASARPVLDGGAALRGGVVVYRDVSERRRAEEKYRGLFENAVEGIFQTTPEGRFLAANPALARMLGYASPEELIAQVTNIGRQIHVEPERRAEFGQQLQAHDVVRGFECPVYRKDGEVIWISLYARAVRDADSSLRRYEGIVEDITERRRAEQALEATRDEFRAARRIQQKMFPAAPPRLAGFDLGGASYPAEATGGDYFDFVPMLDGCVGLVVGDVSGHGFASALLMAETRAFLHALTRAHADVGEIMTLANRALAADIDDDRFITLLFARLDPETRSLDYASAGHLTGYVLDASGAVVARLPSLDPLLGPFPEHVFSASPPRTLNPGEIVVLLTDGITEACAPDETVFGTERALALVRAYRRVGAAEIVANLYHAVRAFTHNRPQLDDMTAIVLKVA
jgi:PAS domain S-box-containing protein